MTLNQRKSHWGPAERSVYRWRLYKRRMRVRKALYDFLENVVKPPEIRVQATPGNDPNEILVDVQVLPLSPSDEEACAAYRNLNAYIASHIHETIPKS